MGTKPVSTFMKPLCHIGLAALVAGLLSCGGGGTLMRPNYIQGVDAQDDGDLHGAIAAYEMALTEQPDDYRIHYNLAVVYHDLFRIEQRLGRKEAAARRRLESTASYDRVLQLRPENIPAALGLSQLSADAGEFKAARDRLAAVSSQSETGQQSLWMAEAQLAGLAGDTSLQKSLLSKVIAVDPVSARAATALAGMELDAGEIDKAESILTPALKAHSFDLGLLGLSAAIALKRAQELQAKHDASDGEKVQGVAEAWIAADLRHRAVLTLSARDRVALLGLSRCLVGRGDIGGAIDFLWRARQSTSNHSLQLAGIDPRAWHLDVQSRLLDLYQRLAEWEKNLTLPSAERVQNSP